MCVFVCVFSSFRAFFGFLATTGEGGGAEAYDSGLGADYSGRGSPRQRTGSSLLGREKLMTADGGAFCVRFVFL